MFERHTDMCVIDDDLFVVEERRPATRVMVSLDARYAVRGMPRRVARIHELSASGLRLITQEQLLLKGLIDIDITINCRDNVHVQAQVVRLASKGGDRFDYGLSIVGDNTVKNALRAIVLAASLKRSIAHSTVMPSYVQRLRTVTPNA